jgi:hypothetical protein
MSITVGTQTNSGNQANATSPQTFTHSTDANTIAVIVVVTIFDVSATEGVVSAVSFDGKALTSRLVEYDATCDGHISVWDRINADVASITNGTVSVAFGGTVTDFVAEIINIETTAGSLAYDSVDTKNVGNGSPMTTSWATVETSEDCIAFGVGLNDQSKSGTIAITTGSDLYIMDVGSDNVFAGYNNYVGGTATASLVWTESDADEDFIVSGCAYVEAAGLSQVNKDMQLLWDIDVLVNKDMQLLFDIDNLVNKDTQLLYDIFNLVNKDKQLLWDILNLVNKDKQLVWDMEGVVNKDIQLLWDIEGPVNKDVQLVWDILNSVNKDTQLIWDITNLVNKDMQLVWDIDNLVNKDIQLLWDILNFVNKDVQLVWDILGSSVYKDITLVYDIESDTLSMMSTDGKTFFIT